MSSLSCNNKQTLAVQAILLWLTDVGCPVDLVIASGCWLSVKFEALSHQLPGGTEESHKILNFVGVFFDILTGHLPCVAT